MQACIEYTRLFIIIKKYILHIKYRHIYNTHTNILHALFVSSYMNLLTLCIEIDKVLKYGLKGLKQIISL